LQHLELAAVSGSAGLSDFVRYASITVRETLAKIEILVNLLNGVYQVARYLVFSTYPFTQLQGLKDILIFFMLREQDHLRFRTGTAEFPCCIYPFSIGILISMMVMSG